MERKSDEDFIGLLGEAVNHWFAYYDAKHDKRDRDILLDAALHFYKDGCQCQSDLATMLIENFVGVAATKVNAPKLISIH
jgi:hypothetical protein